MDLVLGSGLLLGGRWLCSHPDRFMGKRRESCHLDRRYQNRNQIRIWILDLDDRIEGSRVVISPAFKTYQRDEASFSGLWFQGADGVRAINQEADIQTDVILF